MEQKLEDLTKQISNLTTMMVEMKTRLDESEKANKLLIQNIQLIATRGELSNSVLNIGSHIANLTRHPGVTPGGLIKSEIKKELVDVNEKIDEPASNEKVQASNESVPASNEIVPTSDPTVSSVSDTAVEESEEKGTEIDPVEEFFVKHYIDNISFAMYISKDGKQITFRKLLANTYINEFVTLTAKDKRPLKESDFAADNKDEYVPRTIYNIGKRSSNGFIKTTYAVKLFTFITGQYNHNFGQN